MTARRLLGGLVAAGLLLGGASASAAPAAKRPVFALVVGVNRSVDPQLAPLAYADDDAFRYRDLFRSLGAKVVLLARPDDNTRRINRDLGEAREPVDRALNEAVSTLAAEVAAARKAGQRPVLYFVFAGHGNLGKHGAYLTLEDERLTGADLDRRVLRPIGADETHLIVDACYSYLLVHERGAGGRTRDVQGFSRLSGLLERDDVGLLLSTSSARESHEWQEFQAGVFSHEVRSGLYGAADANADGEVSYREIAAFVNWANAAIPNERFRPQVFSRPPRGQARLVDLRSALGNRITVDAAVEPGHHLVEDQDGNRLAEFHNARGTPVRLLRPQTSAVLYVRHLGSGREYELPPGAGERRLGDLASRAAPVKARGAAHHAFTRIFSLPFDGWVVDQFDAGQVEAALRTSAPAQATRAGWRKPVALGLLGVAALTGAGALWATQATHDLASEARRSDQRQAIDLNSRLEIRRSQAFGLGVSAAAAAAGAAVVWFWPGGSIQPEVAIERGGPMWLGARGRF